MKVHLILGHIEEILRNQNFWYRQTDNKDKHGPTKSRENLIFTSGMLNLAPKGLRLAPSGTNPGLFQIRFQYILARRAIGDMTIKFYKVNLVLNWTNTAGSRE